MKSGLYQKLIFLFLNQNIYCGNKRTVSMSCFFKHQKHMLELMGKKIFTVLHKKICLSKPTCNLRIFSGFHFYLKHEGLRGELFIWSLPACVMNCPYISSLNDITQTTGPNRFMFPTNVPHIPLCHPCSTLKKTAARAKNRKIFKQNLCPYLKYFHTNDPHTGIAVDQNLLCCRLK